MKTKIIPVNYTDDLLRACDGETACIGIEEMSVTYTQPADTNSDSDKTQFLTITSRSACSVDMGDARKRDGFYFDITIPQGQHWSVDDGEQLQALVEDFKQRLYMGIEQTEDNHQSK